MNILSISIGFVFFVAIVCFFIFTYLNIKKSESLKKYAKIIGWIGISILGMLVLSGIVSKEANLFISIVFINYIKAVYFTVIAVGMFFIFKKLFSKIKNLITHRKIKTA